MERCITQLEEGEKAREKRGYVNCIFHKYLQHRVATLNDRLVRRREG